MINCTITSPTKTTIYENVRSIILPAFYGKMQILPGHVESFILLRKGDISLRFPDETKRKINSSWDGLRKVLPQDTQDKIIQIMGGECHIKNDTVTVIL